MDKLKSTDSKSSFSAIEKAKEKALKESYHFRDSQTGQFKGSEGQNQKSGSIKITIKK